MKRNKTIARQMRRRKRKDKEHIPHKYSPTYNRWRGSVVDNKMAEAARLSREHYNMFVLNREITFADTIVAA